MPRVTLGACLTDLSTPSSPLPPPPATAHATAGKGDIAYHYTTAEGLRGIITTGKLRLTDTRFMNDASEYHFVNRMLSDVIAGRRSSPDIEAYLGRLTAESLGLLRRNYGKNYLYRNP